MKYFIYCRKSSEEESKQSQSLGTQQRILIKLATENNLEVVDIIKESRSAKDDLNRPLFTRMLERIQAGEADAILVVHPDRLARNLIEAGFITKFIESGVVKEVRTPTRVFNDIFSLMYMGFDFVFAAHYSRDLSLKVKAGNESKLLKGEYPTYAPVGYVNIKPGNGIEPDPIRAPFVTRAFELFATGDYSLGSITKLLADEGFRSRNGKKKGKSSIHRILTNPEYYGVIRRKGKLYEGNHSPLVPKEMFDRVQDVLAGRSRPQKQKHEFLFRDFLVCEECGCKVTAGLAKGKYIYYRCTNGKNNCTQHKRYWNENNVDDVFEVFFDNFTLDSKRAEISFALYREKMLSEAKHKGHSSDAIAHQITSLQNKLTKLEDTYFDELITKERFTERKLEIENEIVELKILQKSNNNKDTLRTLELVEEIKNQAITLSEMYKNGDDDVKRDLLKSVLWNSGFADGKLRSPRITKLWKPLENLNQEADIEKWRRRWDSNRNTFTSSSYRS